VQGTNQGGLLDVLEKQKTTIAGSWLMTINIPDNPPPLNHFKGLAVFTEDGNYISSAQGDVTPSPFPAGTSQYGAWTHLGGRQFALTFLTVLYDIATAEPQGLFKLRQTMTLNDAGDEFTGPFRLDVFDNDEHIVASVTGTVQAKRIKVELLR
jgi:hypothetical protein